MEIVGYVVRITPYREKDAMILTLAKDGYHSFLARGIMTLSSKLSGATSLLSYSRFECENGKQGLVLKGAVGLSSKTNSFSLLSLAAMEATLEAMIKTLDDDNAPAFFPYFHAAMERLQEEGDPLSLLLILIAKMLHLAGYGLQTDGCVKCGETKGIVSLSYRDGGYICQKHFDPHEMVNQNATYLKLVRYLFMVTPEEMGRLTFPSLEATTLLHDLVSYAEEMTGSKWKGMDLFYRVLQTS